METRRLGRSDLQVSPICFGGNVFGWTVPRETAFSLLDRFVEAGGNFVDTADVYSTWVPGHAGGESEAIIGEWLKRGGQSLRDRIVIATKVGSDMGGGRKGLSPKWIARAVEDSLRRLQTDRIDLYQSHRDDPDTAIEATLEAYAKLVETGKVRFIGASNFSPDRLVKSLDIAEHDGLPRYESLQPEHNLYERRGFEAELEPICRDREVGVIPYYALASGFLTGKYRKAEDAGASVRGNAVVTRYLNARGFKILDALDRVAKRLEATPGRVAIAWQKAHAPITAPIASATSLAQVEDLIAAASLVLDANALAELDEASA